MQVVGFLNDKEETDVLAALRCPDVGRLNEVVIAFAEFIESAEGNYAFYFNIFRMLQKLIADLGSLNANRDTETLMKAVSKRFSETTDFNIMFTCFLVARIGIRYCGTVARPSAFAASMETMWSMGVTASATLFSCDIAQMTRLF
jgi:magnesium-transporting ATPase (P-type)